MKNIAIRSFMIVFLNRFAGLLGVGAGYLISGGQAYLAYAISAIVIGGFGFVTCIVCNLIYQILLSSENLKYRLLNEMLDPILICGIVLDGVWIGVLFSGQEIGTPLLVLLIVAAQMLQLAFQASYIYNHHKKLVVA